MTRENLIPVYELSDQHLLAEYKEIVRAILQSINIINAPTIYCLGKGHVKWAAKYGLFTILRYRKIINELHYRGFKTNYKASDLLKFAKNNNRSLLNYTPTAKDILISKNRIIEKIKQKPNWYKWTNRNIPRYLKNIIKK